MRRRGQAMALRHPCETICLRTTVLAFVISGASAFGARKVDSAIVRMPRQGRPSSTVLELETVLGWLGRFVAAR